MANDLADQIFKLLYEYVKSPSVAHIRDAYMLRKLAVKVARLVERTSGTWNKWDDDRDRVLVQAMPTWVPIEDLREYLNSMQGRQTDQHRYRAAQKCSP